MSNILAIAHKELKSYFSSPIAYIAIGMWALLYGYFFITILSFFVRQSMQMSQMGVQGPQAMNLNQQLIRPLLVLHPGDVELGPIVQIDAGLDELVGEERRSAVGVAIRGDAEVRAEHEVRVVRVDQHLTAVTAGDVVHLRPT